MKYTFKIRLGIIGILLIILFIFLISIKMLFSIEIIEIYCGFISLIVTSYWAYITIKYYSIFLDVLYIYDDRFECVNLNKKTVLSYINVCCVEKKRLPTNPTLKYYYYIIRDTKGNIIHISTEHPYFEDIMNKINQYSKLDNIL